MCNQERSIRLAVLLILGISRVAECSNPNHSHPTEEASVITATPAQDDANLYKVQFLGSKIGWAVGDRGVIWHTRDGGLTWQLLASPVDCALRGICFLTDRVGWIVGGKTAPDTRIQSGVVLFTTDGGASWQQLARDQLPSLNSVHFFNLQDGVALGGSSPEHPTGILRTDDGGKSWQDVSGPRTRGWRTADFLTPDVGAVAGLNGRWNALDGSRLLPAPLTQYGLRGLHALQLQPGGIGWMVGDGGLILRTDPDRITWKSPQTLPGELRNIFDFRAVACSGEKAWIAGNPGSVIWHTPDGGWSWHKQPTRQTAPIYALHFTSESQGWAAGAMGLILKTEDAGQTWTALRGGGRHAALMLAHARPNQLSMSLLAKMSADQGYRSMALLATRRDVGPMADGRDDFDQQLQDAISAAGGCESEIGWRLSVDIPGLERDWEKLVAEWKRQTDDQLQEALLGKLVCRLRTWKPMILVLSQPAPDDATTALLNDALLRAVEQAADPTRFIAHSRLANLQPWQVRKVYMRLPTGSTGQVHFDPHEFLPRLGQSAQSAAAPAYARLQDQPNVLAEHETYQLVLDRTQSTSPSPRVGDFFTETPIATGSAARRSLQSIDGRDYEQRKKIAQRQRNFEAFRKRLLDDPRHAGQMVAQLDDIIGGMPEDQAARQLAALAADYRRTMQWDLVEATLTELVARYPDQAPSRAAMQWLLQFWASEETAWQRSHQGAYQARQLTTNVQAVQDRIDRAKQMQRAMLDSLAELEFGDIQPIEFSTAPLQVRTHSGHMKISASDDWRSHAVRHWHQKALRMARLIQQEAPALYRTPEIQFPLASLMRRRSLPHLSHRLYRKFGREADGDLWERSARGELWLQNPINLPPKTVTRCRYTEIRPNLDAVLSDACWQETEPIFLRTSDGETSENVHSPLVMLAHDSEHLYLAASLPRHEGCSYTPPVETGRTHDADLSGYDRVSFHFDIDRDYATWYTFHIDQRGWTAESCWDDTNWNPTWYVAASLDDSHWRVEAAIPLKELVPHPQAMRQSVWALGIIRTIPTVGVQSWTLPARNRPRPESFGLLKFD